MKSSHDDVRDKGPGDQGIIRGADIQGVVFCSPTGIIQDPIQVKKQEQENLKALEDYWYKKGFSDGKKEGFDAGYQSGEEEGLRKGDQEGYSRGLSEGEKTGHDLGFSEGESKALDAFQSKVDALVSITSSVQKETVHIFESVRADLIALSIQIAEVVLRKELKDQDSYRSLIQELLIQAEPIISDEAIRIVLSPEDFAMIDGFTKELKTPSSQNLDLLLVRNPLLSAGDVRVETGLGLLNFDIKRQLAEIEKNVLELQPEPQETPHEPEPCQGD